MANHSPLFLGNRTPSVIKHLGHSLVVPDARWDGFGKHTNLVTVASLSLKFWTSCGGMLLTVLLFFCVDLTGVDYWTAIL